MPQSDSNIDDKNHSTKVKTGIRRARALRGNKWGRPSIAAVKGDSNLAAKASELRDLGLSWSQIASKLGVGRSTARRLANLFQKEVNNQNLCCAQNIVPERRVSGTYQKDNRGTISNQLTSEPALETAGDIEHVAERRMEFVGAALQFVLENEHLLTQVLKKIGAQPTVRE